MFSIVAPKLSPHYKINSSGTTSKSFDRRTGSRGATPSASSPSRGPPSGSWRNTTQTSQSSTRTLNGCRFPANPGSTSTSTRTGLECPTRAHPSAAARKTASSSTTSTGLAQSRKRQVKIFQFLFFHTVPKPNSSKKMFRFVQLCRSSKEYFISDLTLWNLFLCLHFQVHRPLQLQFTISKQPIT